MSSTDAKRKRKGGKRKPKVERQHVVFGSDDEDEDGNERQDKTKTSGSTGGSGDAEGADEVKESRRERKRRRRIERGEKADDPAKKIKKEAPPPLEKKRKYFRGKVFGISVRSNKEDGDDDNEDGPADNAQGTEGDDAKALGFDELRTLIEDAGGKMSGILHKRVFALVASERAVRRRSQKVRKAVKFNVPVVSEAFLTACAEAKACVAVDPYLREVPEAEPTSASDNTDTKKDKKSKKSKKDKKSKKSKKSKADDFEVIEDGSDSAETTAIAPVLEVDLGCCCSCHDEGKPSCEWCEKHH
ncbi:Poly ADP-ribose polymerase 1 [Hondaea fermentalgiana]|uniref:Poly ADP-ribose polymerase 1 n=1 Tax=Hondaea fermentalgiana TaxID=2315210 RepID=A0A2R5GL61_9STRA|nr:Poly ADP-ribose polymerase 1 [Hondaea fermentalgiana]|eukprot:GBG31610.1 Poly ADP-ribose polymerase 1 [Hondaea fermentalgiana]